MLVRRLVGARRKEYLMSPPDIYYIMSVQVKGSSKDETKYPVSPELIVSTIVLVTIALITILAALIIVPVISIITTHFQALFVFVVIGSAVFQIIQSVWMSGP